jgi:hypothetical protein
MHRPRHAPAEEEGNRTRVTLRHAGVPDDDFGRQHREGWAYVLGAIEDRFAKGRR